MGLEYADGITVIGKSYEADITPVSFDGLGYEGAFVYEPRKGFDEHLFYYTFNQGAEFSNGFYTWNVNTEGRITSVKPFGGTPPLPGKIKGLPKGFKEVKQFGRSHGQRVYEFKGKYYSKDVGSGNGRGSHNGGIWKVFKLNNGKLQRIGTADENLNIFKD